MMYATLCKTRFYLHSQYSSNSVSFISQLVRFLLHSPKLFQRSVFRHGALSAVVSFSVQTGYSCQCIRVHEFKLCLYSFTLPQSVFYFTTLVTTARIVRAYHRRALAAVLEQVFGE